MDAFYWKASAPEIVSPGREEQGADLLLTVKNNQCTLLRQIVAQFRGHRHFPVAISDFEAGHVRQVRWHLRARNATEAIRERWSGASWIIELVSTGVRDGNQFRHVHHFITTLRTSPKALLAAPGEAALGH